MLGLAKARPPTKPRSTSSIRCSRNRCKSLIDEALLLEDELAALMRPAHARQKRHAEEVDTERAPCAGHPPGHRTQKCPPLPRVSVTVRELLDCGRAVPCAIGNGTAATCAVRSARRASTTPIASTTPARRRIMRMVFAPRPSHAAESMPACKAGLTRHPRGPAVAPDGERGVEPIDRIWRNILRARRAAWRAGWVRRRAGRPARNGGDSGPSSRL